MRKIINGKMYDTDTAEYLGCWTNGYSYNDFHYCVQKLYRKKTGEYFLFGEGGSMSMYAESYGNDITGGTRFTPMTEEEAKAWSEVNLTTDEYISVWGEVNE